jgi:hypothetical protein
MAASKAEHTAHKVWHDDSPEAEQAEQA